MLKGFADGPAGAWDAGRQLIAVQLSASLQQPHVGPQVVAEQRCEGVGGLHTVSFLIVAGSSTKEG